MFNFRDALDEDKIEAMMAWTDGDYSSGRVRKEPRVPRSGCPDPRRVRFPLAFEATNGSIDTHPGGWPDRE
jgi:hypothetical protein